MHDLNLPNKSTSNCRVLMVSDTHLGSKENGILFRDSFAALEEALKLGLDLKVDAVIIPGDFFHAVNPSSDTRELTKLLLSLYCRYGGGGGGGGESTTPELINCPKGALAAKEPNFSKVRLAVFVTHGNHDTLAQEWGKGPIDELSEEGLVNYLGKTLVRGVGDGAIASAPIVFSKEGIEIALYGFGNIRDPTMAKISGHGVTVKPAEEEGEEGGGGGEEEEEVVESGSKEGGGAAAAAVAVTSGGTSSAAAAVELGNDDKGGMTLVESPGGTDGKFNVLVLHQQRRVSSVDPSSGVSEALLPDFLDLVVWGHEHKCCPPREKGAGGRKPFSTLQPGSVVRTQLTEGAASENVAYLLEITRAPPDGNGGPFLFDLVPHPLRTGRLYAFGKINVIDVAQARKWDAGDCNFHTTCRARLISCVDFLLSEARAAAEARGPPPAYALGGVIKLVHADRPLIKLQVAGYEHQPRLKRDLEDLYRDRVADPKNMISFVRDPGGRDSIGRASDADADADAGPPAEVAAAVHAVFEVGKRRLEEAQDAAAAETTADDGRKQKRKREGQI